LSLDGKTLLPLLESELAYRRGVVKLEARGCRGAKPRVEVLPRSCRDEALDVTADSRGEEMRA
jgi:hypothetical protein